MKTEKLIKCIEMIKTERVKKTAIVLVEMLPDYFFEMPASTTGKYHPSYALGYEGLIRHTKAAFKVAYEMLYNNSFLNFSELEKDLCLLSILVHDGLKLGINNDKWTRFDHPLVMANFIEEKKSFLFLSDEEIKIVTNAISSHTGPWNTNPREEVVLPLPITDIEKFVHMCDFLASRKFIEIDMSDL